VQCFLVSHTHWDREWHKTFQGFRARLIDAVDLVLDRIAEDPGFRFLLDGQAVVLEDYLEIRPARRKELEAACRDGRIAVGPWYVQPDSFLPSGEAHVRNLLEGGRVASALGPVSRVAYTPDSFGHPAQLPQIFAGFGLGPFVYWRGHGDEIDALPAEWTWEAPDGSAVQAVHLAESYSAASGLSRDPERAAETLAKVVEKLAARSRSGRLLLMNGTDHTPPDPHTKAVAEALARRTGMEVRRALLDEFAEGLPSDGPRFLGELCGGRIANLLPGVWSTRMPLKLRNRRCEALLEGWAEPWSALGRALGLADESAALRAAWRPLLQNQAHDSICGCSQDRVHEQMQARYDASEELADETTARILERLAGLDAERSTPWSDEIDVAVFNPSPRAQSGVARIPLDPYPSGRLRHGDRESGIHPLLRANRRAEGYEVDGVPARLVPYEGTSRIWALDRPIHFVEFVARDVPALGCKRVRLRRSGRAPDVEDDGREIARDGLAVRAREDGTFDVEIGGRAYGGLCALEDRGDRGDSYDFDPVDGPAPRLEEVRVRRRVHPSGVAHLTVRRRLAVPAAFDESSGRRTEALAPLVVETEARLAPGARRIDLRVRVENGARDHRLRMLFPTGAPAASCVASTTFDVAKRSTAPREASRWIHPAPATFPQQGFVSARGLTVAAPGLPEAEVTPEGVVAITLLRAVGWLSRIRLESRPQAAGPPIPAPGAQCPGRLEARLALLADAEPCAVREAELGLRAVAAGNAPLLPPGAPLLSVEPEAALLSALKPAEDGDGMVLRLLNPTGAEIDARVRLGFPASRARAVRLDETPSDEPVTLQGARLAFPLPPHALRSVRLS
jgi:mannosylglycerate hydrolase